MKDFLQILGVVFLVSSILYGLNYFYYQNHCCPVKPELVNFFV